MIFSGLKVFKNNLQTEEKWSKNSRCYAIDNFRDTSDHYHNLFIGKNQNTGMNVYAKLIDIDKDENLLISEIYPYKYNFYSIYYVSKSYFPEIRRNKYFFDHEYYFTLLYKTCTLVRNEGEGAPSGFQEKKDEILSFKYYNKCNYICRTVYNDERGLCIYEPKKDTSYTCTYIIPDKTIYNLNNIKK